MPTSASALAAELLQALQEWSGAEFSPSELLPALRAGETWADYLNEFESERGQSAAVGRFLVDVGAGKAGHHRTRGSLYTVAEARERLQVALTALPSTEPVAGGMPRRRHGERAPLSFSVGAGGAAAAPARSRALGWHRRAEDVSRPAAEAEAVTVQAPMAAAYTVPVEFSTPAEEPGLPLAFYWTQVRRHLYKIILFAVLITAAVAFYTLRIPKLYESVATLRMDFRAPAIQADANANPAFDPYVLIQTEVRDVSQRSVVVEAIHNAHLDRNADLARQLGAATKAPAPTASDPSANLDPLIALIQAHTHALQPDNTHNIDIHFRSLDPATSATVANAMAQALIVHEFQTRQQEQNDQLRFMQQQFTDIGVRVEKEQTALTAYQHQHNLLNLDNQSSLESTTLQSLNASHLAAQAQLTKYQAEENSLHSGQLTDALLASDDGQNLRPYYNAWQQAEQHFAAIQTTRGSANPAYVAAAHAAQLAQAQLQQAVAGVEAQIQAQYARARDQVTLVGGQLQAARGAMQAFNDKAIDYNQMKRDLDADQALHDKLQAQIKQQQLTSSLSDSGLRVTNRATPNPAPVYPNVKQNAVLALLFSLFGGCALAIMLGYLDRSFTAPDVVEQYLRVPLLGALPVMESGGRMLELAQPELDREGKPAARSAFTEAILMLRTALLFAAPPGVRSFCVTSAQPQEGKSAVVANLGVALALHGAKVLLVDTDLRRPTLHRVFAMPNAVGLTTLLRQIAPLEDCIRPTAVERLYLLPSGPAVANPSELLSTMLGQALAPLAAEFDYILFDSPPVLGFADAMAVAAAAEGTLLLARAGKTPREIVQAALQSLQRVRANVMGLALNQVSSSLSPYYAYYHDHYRRYSTDEEGGERA